MDVHCDGNIAHGHEGRIKKHICILSGSKVYNIMLWSGGVVTESFHNLNNRDKREMQKRGDRP